MSYRAVGLRGIFLPALVICLGQPMAVAGAEPARGEPWLSKEAFSVPARDLAQAAAALPGRESGTLEMLLHETTIAYDAEGRATTTTHSLYRILGQGGVDAGSAVRTTWSPWREKKPSVRARVIAADGTQHELDPNALADAPLGSSERNVFSDMRVIEGPLPAVAPGSVIEMETVVAEIEPLFAAGTVRRVVVARFIPSRGGRVRIEAPDSLELHYSVRPAGLFHESVETAGGVHRRTFEFEKFEPPSNEEAHLPPDLDPSAMISVATGRSWREVAAAYSKMVEGRIEGSDVKGEVLKVAKASMTRPEKVLALVRHLHETVRYTGVEFAWAGIVPEKPSVTLARKYGDCKDKSVLLVALLREAGIPAHLALVSSGGDPDVDPALPGLGGFDHAIVKVEGDTPMWIDATEEYLEPGRLDASLAGRLALVVRDDAAALEPLPEASSSDHHTIETREFSLVEEGPAGVVEITSATGGPGRRYRANFATSDAKGLREGLEGYVRKTYEARSLEHYEWTDVNDPSQPFGIRLVAAGAGVGRSNGSEIRVPIPLHELAASISVMVPAREPLGEIARGNGGEARDPERRAAFFLPEPALSEWRYRIHAPEGFSLLPLPQPVRISIGPATLAASFRKESDGSVSVDASFDTGPRRWTAGQYEAARSAMYELYRDSPWFVSFEQDGQVHLKAGRLMEAMSEFRRLAELHPKEAIHHAQMAMVLLDAGFGSAARAEATKAVETDPRSSSAREQLGMTFLHDSLGREFRTGWNRSRALAEFRKAKELDPRSIPPRTLLALTLEYDEDGVRYASDSSLAEAIEEYRSLREDFGDTSADVNVLRCLGHMGRFQEVREEASKLPESPERNALLIAAIAASASVDDARSESVRLSPGMQERRQLMATAAWTLMSFRRYKEGTALLEEGMEGSPNPQTQTLFKILKKTRRHEEISFDLTRPEEVVRAAARGLLLTRDLISPETRALFSRHFRIEESEQKKLLTASRYSLTESVGKIFTMEGIVDLGLAGLETEVSAIGTVGYRVRTSAPSPGASQHTDTLLDTEDGGLRIVADTSDIVGAGALVESLVEKGDLESARTWLNQIREFLRGASTDDPIDGHPMAILWPSGGLADPRWMRAGASVLQVKPGSPRDVAPILEEVRDQIEEPERWKLDYALAMAYATAGKNEEAVACAKRLLAAYPRSDRARNLLGGNLMTLGRADEVEDLARAWLAEDPTSATGLRFLLGAAQERRDVDEALKRFTRLQEAGRAEASDLNNQAWFLLDAGRSSNALDLAERAVREQGAPAVLHTLASVLADLGRLSEARATILRKIDLFNGGEPEPVDAFVFGRIAESLGEADLAASAYERVLADPERSRSVIHIVQERLKGLRTKPAAGKGTRTTKSQG